MSIFNWCMFVATLLGLYLSGVLTNRMIKKKWHFKISAPVILIFLFISYASGELSDIFADAYVKAKVPHEWKEQVVAVGVVEDVVRSREQTGSFIFGIGDMYERETFRYSVINQDGSRVREKIYTSDCVILKSPDEAKKSIAFVKNVRVYKNPEDKVFFENWGDVKHGFYKV